MNYNENNYDDESYYVYDSDDMRDTNDGSDEDGEGEEEAAFLDQLCAAEELDADEPDRALEILTALLASEPSHSTAALRYRVLHALCLLCSRLGRLDDVRCYFRDMLGLLPSVGRVECGVAMLQVLDTINTAAAANTSCRVLAEELHELAVSAAEGAGFEALWFAVSTRQVRLWLEAGQTGTGTARAQQRLRTLERSCQHADGSEDGGKAGGMLELLYLQARVDCAAGAPPDLASTQQRHSRLLCLQRLTVAPDHRIVGFLHEQLGLALLRGGEWDAGFCVMYEAYLSYQQASSQVRRREVLAYLYALAMLLFNTADPLSFVMRGGRKMGGGGGERHVAVPRLERERSAQEEMAVLRGAVQRNCLAEVEALLEAGVLTRIDNNPHVISCLGAARQSARYNIYWMLIDLVAGNDWLDIDSLMRLDAATNNRECRSHFLVVAAARFPLTPQFASSQLAVSPRELDWLVRRDIRPRHLTLRDPRNPALDVLLARVAPQLTQLQTLSIHGSRALSEEAVFRVARHCPELRHLDLRGCERAVTDKALRLIARDCPRLLSLNIADCSMHSDVGVSAIADGCPSLRALWLSCGRRLTDDTVLCLAEGCPELTLLSLQHCVHLTDTSFFALADHCRQLETLLFGDCELVTNAAVARLTWRCPQLREVALPQGVSDAGVEELARRCGPTLLGVTLGPLVTDTGVRALANSCTGLQGLHAAACVLVTDASILPLVRANPDLRDVALSRRISAAVIGLVAELCRRLRSLRLLCLSSAILFAANEQNTLARSNDEANDLCILEVTTKCRELTTLELVGCVRLSDAGVKRIVRAAPQLVHLSVAGCTDLTGSAIDQIIDCCAKLESLNISRNPNINYTHNSLLLRLCEMLPCLRTLTVDRRLGEWSCSGSGSGLERIRQIAHVIVVYV